MFEIVQGLLEIQHLTEKSLYNQRLRLQNEHRGARGRWEDAQSSGRLACPRSARCLRAEPFPGCLSEEVPKIYQIKGAETLLVLFLVTDESRQFLVLFFVSSRALF